MSWILVSNDDGVDSPALVPFTTALEAALGVPARICVPAFERSWSSKAVTRHGDVRAEVVQRAGRDIVAVDGTPADAVQLGLYALFTEEFGGAPPQMVLTGINLGYNSGGGFMASSGTVWAAVEGTLAGLPAVAVSTGPTLGMEDFKNWGRSVREPDAEADWHRVARVAADIVGDVAGSDVLEHCDLVSVNLPWDATMDGTRTVTQLTPLAYGPLFDPTDVGSWRFTADLTVQLGETDGPGDVATLQAGDTSITPLVLPRTPEVPAATRTALERG